MCCFLLLRPTPRSSEGGWRDRCWRGAPSVVPKTDISTTRVAACFNMIHSVLLLNKALKAFVRVYDGVDLTWRITDDNWEALAEMEAVAKVITDVTTRVQTENSQMGAMGHLIHLRLLEQLRSSELLVLDLDNISKTEQPRKPRQYLTPP